MRSFFWKEVKREKGKGENSAGKMRKEDGMLVGVVRKSMNSSVKFRNINQIGNCLQSQIKKNEIEKAFGKLKLGRLHALVALQEMLRCVGKKQL